MIYACTTFGLFVVFPGVFLSSRVTGACPVTTDSIMRVYVRTTTCNRMLNGDCDVSIFIDRYYETFDTALYQQTSYASTFMCTGHQTDDTLDHLFNPQLLQQCMISVHIITVLSQYELLCISPYLAYEGFQLLMPHRFWKKLIGNLSRPSVRPSVYVLLFYHTW